MCFLHNEKIVHRDLKPHNLLLDQKNNIKIADFGLSRMFSSQQQTSSPTNNSNARAAMGTPVYMAPELFTQSLKKRSLRLESEEKKEEDEDNNNDDDDTIDFLTGKRADVYAYGITLAAMLLPGAKPYPSLRTMTAVALHVSCGHRPSLPRTCPTEIAKLIRMCWSSKSSERPTFANISQQLQDIDGVVGSPKRRNSFGGHTTKNFSRIGDGDDGDFDPDNAFDRDSIGDNCVDNTTVRLDINNTTTSTRKDLHMALKDMEN